MDNPLGASQLNDAHQKAHTHKNWYKARIDREGERKKNMISKTKLGEKHIFAPALSNNSKNVHLVQGNNQWLWLIKAFQISENENFLFVFIVVFFSP